MYIFLVFKNKINVAGGNDIMAKKKQTAISIWEIRGDEALNEQAEIIAEIRQGVKDSEEKILELEEQINVANSRINMYIENTLGVENYDNHKHLIVINEEYEASIYPISFFSTEKETIISDLPKPDETYKLTKNQATKILTMVQEYNNMALDFEIEVDEYDDMLDYHEELWDEIYKVLKQTKMFKFYDGEETGDIELFDEDKHTLLITKDENSGWSFKYIRKNDEEQFYKDLKDKAEK
ncbi:hypothetical protein D3C75_685380 [compost metagenome]